MHIGDPQAARSAALGIIQINMPNSVSDEIASVEEIQFGTWDTATRTFVPGEIDANSVRLQSSRTNAKSNAAKTYLLNLAGIENWEVSVVSMATARTGPVSDGCIGASIISSNMIDTGGGNVITSSFCIHGVIGVHTGGGDFHDETVQISAENIGDVTINYTVPGSATAEQVAAERDQDLQVLPLVGVMLDDLWEEMRDGGATT